MKKSGWIITTVLFITIAAFLLISLTKSKTSVSIKIGVIVDLTGPMAINGQWSQEGIAIAKEELISSGKKIELLIEDSMGDPKAAVAALQKLININKVKIIIASNASSSDIMAMAPIAEKNQIILFVTTASSPSIANSGDFIFRNRLSGDKEVEAVVKAAANRKISRIAFATLNNQAGYAYANFFENAVAMHNLKISDKELINIDETDFRTISTKLKGSGAEALFYAGPIKIGTMLIKGCTEIGFNPQWLGISSMRSKELFEFSGDLAEGLILATEFPDSSSIKYNILANKYREKYKGEPNTFTVNAYDALIFLAESINSVGYDSIKIKDFLYTHEFKGAGGTMRFDANGDAIRKVQLMQVKKGEFVLLEN